MFWAAIFYWSALRHVWFIFDESNASSPNSWINGSFELVRFSDLHYNWFLDEWLFWTGWFWWIKSHNDQCSPIPERMHLLNRSSVFTIPKNDFFFELCSVSFAQFPAGRSPKTLNGLLSPLCEERVGVSQSSLCDKLQEKDRSWAGSLTAEGGGSKDHSAILPLRSKNFREKSDVHFVEVIKEDRWVKEDLFV